jgi:glycosyltransferase involved in cell wall biosynthesis
MLISLLTCTYNRAADLAEYLASADRQVVSDVDYEIVVIDNGSTDDTPAVVEAFRKSSRRAVTFAVEPTPGKSHALNLGLRLLKGSTYVIADDDFILPPDWVQNIANAFRRRPDMSFVGGKVLPLWGGLAPRWLTQDHWSALALADYGEREFIADYTKRICLLACAFRTEHVLEVGGYDTSLGVNRGRIGGTEDARILDRLWEAGRYGLYDPTVWFRHKVPASRMTKAYHRKWHMDHGRSYAMMMVPEIERSRARVADVPVHLIRQAFADIAECALALARSNTDSAFSHELKLRFAAGFIYHRLRNGCAP